MARRVDVAEQDVSAGSLGIRMMMMLSALSPEDVRDRDMVAVRRVSQIAVEATAHCNYGHQKSGQQKANGELHAGREPQGTPEVKLKVSTHELCGLQRRRIAPLTGGEAQRWRLHVP